MSCAVTALQASMVARPCVTSAACVLLWYGFGTAYAASTSCPATGATLGGSQGFLRSGSCLEPCTMHLRGGGQHGGRQQQRRDPPELRGLGCSQVAWVHQRKKAATFGPEGPAWG